MVLRFAGDVIEFCQSHVPKKLITLAGKKKNNELPEEEIGRDFSLVAGGRVSQNCLHN